MRKDLGTLITWMTSGGRVGGRSPTTNLCAITIEWVSYQWSRALSILWTSRVLAISLERLMIKSSALFECWPLPPMSISHPPDAIHVIGLPCFFCCSSASVYCTERKPKDKKKQKKKNGGNEASINSEYSTLLCQHALLVTVGVYGWVWKVISLECQH